MPVPDYLRNWEKSIYKYEQVVNTRVQTSIIEQPYKIGVNQIVSERLPKLPAKNV